MGSWVWQRAGKWRAWIGGESSRARRRVQEMRVLVLTPEIKRASYRLRIGDVFPRVPGLEWETVELPRSGAELNREIDRADEFDVVVLQKRLLERSAAWRLRNKARKVVYEVDDAVMVTRPGGEWWWPARQRRARFAATAEILDLAVVGNTYLAEQMKARGARTEIIPTCVDPAEYGARLSYAKAEAAPLRLVWIGSSSTRPYLEEILPALEAASAELSGRLKLLVIADTAPSGNSHLSVEFERWSLAGEKTAMAICDIGIAPTPDDAWSRGKCGFKLVQYMASGLPTIASPIGANAEIVRNGETGIHATSRREWTEAVVRLSKESALRERFGRAGRCLVESDFAVEGAAKNWTEIFRELAHFRGYTEKH